MRVGCHVLSPSPPTQTQGESGEQRILDKPPVKAGRGAHPRVFSWSKAGFRRFLIPDTLIMPNFLPAGQVSTMLSPRAFFTTPSGRRVCVAVGWRGWGVEGVKISEKVDLGVGVYGGCLWSKI